MSDLGSGASPPTSFDEFQDLVEIGRGGFAVVYRASQPRFGRTVAVKVIDAAADEKAVERFERECAAMGMLSSHPNIVTVFDAGVRDSGEPYLVMEYMPQGSFDVRLRTGPLGWEEVVDVGVKLAGALETAHDATILHRDVKPANVLTSSFGEPCLGDFGLARFHGASSTAGMVSATLLHAPPEILAGVPATPQSDLYSLGSTLHTLLTARAPFHRDDDESVLPLFARIADEPVPDLRPRGVPDSVCTAIERSMAKAPEDRQPSLGAFAEELRAAQIGEAITATPLRVNRTSAEEAAKALQSGERTIQRDGRETIRIGATPPPSRPGDSGETVHVATQPPAPGAAPSPAAKPRKRRTGLLVVGLLLLVVIAGGVFAALSLRGSGSEDEASPNAEGATAPTVTTQPLNRQEAADQLAGLVNEFRESEGLEALEIDTNLADAARARSSVLADNNALSQTPALNEEFPGQFTILGENALSGDSVESIQQSSQDSPAQRENLLKTDWTSMGVGVAFSDDRQTMFAVAYFGQRSG